MTRLAAWLVAVATAGAPLLAQGQPPPAQGQGTGEAPPRAGTQRPGGAGRGVTPAELAQMLNALTLMRAQEVLNLRDDQYAPFISALRTFLTTRQRLENQRNRFLGELRQALQAADASDAVLGDRLKALRDHETQAAATMKQRWDDIDAVLDVRQQARFRVLEREMEQQQLDLLMRARGAARGAARGR